MIARVLPYERSEGPANMARDEAMLESAAVSGQALFRAYAWTPATLSLGYFQSIEAPERTSRWADQPTVRRPSGGGALWHDSEVTYALALPATHSLARRHRDLYEAVHEAIAQGLRELGIPASRRGPVSGVAGRPFLCFQDRDPDDVVVGSQKIVGSAQRRRGGAILQHGALLLAAADLTPELPGLRDLVQEQPEPADWPRWLEARVLAGCGLVAEAGDWTATERGRIMELEVKYSSSQWRDRR